MEPIAALKLVGIAVALGLLVGLQRQRAESRLGGIRTFPLIAALGAVAALLVAHLGPWIVGGGLVAVAALACVSVWAQPRDHEDVGGVTTAIAAVLMYLLGAYVVLGSVVVAAVVAGGAAILLHLKEPMHALVRRLGPEDVAAVMRFALISLVILPLLPDRAYGPYQVLNPREIWLMVVLIVGIGLAGYVAWKFLGGRGGSLLAGVLGGTISSTATTVGYARLARSGAVAVPLAAAVVVIASTIAYGRVLIEIAVVAPAQLRAMGLPLAAQMALMAVIAAALWWRAREAPSDPSRQGNPAELRTALVFGAIYAGVLLAVAYAQHRFGAGALYAVAVVSGLTDMDAATLSAARMTNQGQIEPGTAWRLVMVASLSNLAFKGAAAALLGGAELGRRLAIPFAVALVGGAAITWLWP